MQPCRWKINSIQSIFCRNHAFEHFYNAHNFSLLFLKHNIFKMSLKKNSVLRLLMFWQYFKCSFVWTAYTLHDMLIIRHIRIPNTIGVNYVDWKQSRVDLITGMLARSPTLNFSIRYFLIKMLIKKMMTDFSMHISYT